MSFKIAVPYFSSWLWSLFISLLHDFPLFSYYSLTPPLISYFFFNFSTRILSISTSINIFSIPVYVFYKFSILATFITSIVIFSYGTVSFFSRCIYTPSPLLSLSIHNLISLQIPRLPTFFLHSWIFLLFFFNSFSFCFLVVIYLHTLTRKLWILVQIYS